MKAPCSSGFEFLRAFCTAWMLALAAPAVAQPPAIPAEFQDLALEMTRQLDTFDATLATRWDGTRHPVTPAATLLTANGNRGLQLLAPGVPGGVDLELDRLSALGLRAVTVSVNYPLLDPVFLAESGRPEAYEGLLSFYESVASKVRLRGMKLTVETGAMFPGIYSEGSGLEAGPFFAKQTDNQYIAGRTAHAVVLARRMRPDVMNLGSEPDTESRLSGRSVIRSPAAFASMVRGMVESIHAEGLTGVALVSGTGTWDSSASAYVAALVEIPGLWGIDLHVYPVNRDFLDRLLTLADQARSRGKHVTMLECWLQKIRDSELGTIDSAFDSTVFARDSWTFWEPLDRRFFSAMVRAAHAARIDYVSAFWSRIFFGNLDHTTTMAASPLPGSDAIIRLATAAAADSILSGKTTPTGRSFSALITGEPTELTVVKSVPVVLETMGAGGARYSTELTLANRGTTPVQATLSYTPAESLGASGEGEVAVGLPAGRQIVLADTVAYLRERGLPIPVGTNQGGMLRITFRGASSADALSAGARTTTPSGSGRAGLSYPAVASLDARMGTSLVYGLRSNLADRTNLALVNTGKEPVTLRVTLYSGEAGAFRTHVLSPDVTVGPGQWTQIDRVLEKAGFSNGYARIDTVSSKGPYLAYAVFNDNVTNDGSYIASESGLRLSEARLVPVLVETGTYESELVLTNPTSAAQRVTLSYREALSPAGGAGGSMTFDLAPAEQRILPGAIDFLRRGGVAVGPRGQASYAGSLLVEFRSGGAVSSGFAGARTMAPAPGGGAYGLFYPATGFSFAATEEVWIHGLRQDSETRANVAITAFPDAGEDLTLRLEVFDGETGSVAGEGAVITLSPGEWTQINGVQRTAGVSNGYVRITWISGRGRFVAYGVVNDGESPGSGATNDGSFVAMSEY